MEKNALDGAVQPAAVISQMIEKLPEIAMAIAGSSIQDRPDRRDQLRRGLSWCQPRQPDVADIMAQVRKRSSHHRDRYH